MNIKPITLKDANIISLLHQNCFLKYWSDSEFIKLLKLNSTYAWGYYNKQELIAFIMINVILDESEILTICVDPNHRKQAIAQKLLSYVIDFLYTKKMNKLFLEVNEKNKIAQHLYNKLGFSNIAIRKNYYISDKETNDAVVMAFNFCYNG